MLVTESCRCVKPLFDLMDCSHPFTFITAVAFFMLGAPVVMIGSALLADTSGDACEASGLRTDLAVQAGLFIVHFLFFVYLHTRFTVAEPVALVYKRFGEMFM